MKTENSTINSDSKDIDTTNDEVINILPKKEDGPETKKTNLKKKSLIIRLVQRFNALNRRNKGIVIGIFTIFLIAFFVFINIGLDAFVFKAEVTGLVVNQNQEGIEGAEVSIESGKEDVKTDIDGKFVIEGVRPGKKKITIRHQTYKTLEKFVNVTRSGNIEGIYVLDFSENYGLKGKVTSLNKIKLDQLKISYGSREVNYTNEGDFEDNNVEANEGQLRITSPFYKDIIRDIKLNPGSNELGNIELTEAFDQKITLSDWLTSNKINNKKIKVNGLDYETDSFGIVLTKDLETGITNKIAIEVEGFRKKEVDLPNNSGENFEIVLVNDVRASFTSQRSGVVDVFTADVDGSNESKLTNSKISATKVNRRDNTIYFSNGGYEDGTNGKNVEFFSVDIGGGELKKLANKEPNDKDLIFLEANKISKTAVYYKKANRDKDKFLEVYLKPFDATEAVKIFDRKEIDGNNVYLTSNVFSQSGQVFGFGVEEVKINPYTGIYSGAFYYDSAKKELKNVYETEQKGGTVYVQAISNNGQYIWFNAISTQTKTFAGIYNTSVGRFGQYENLALASTASLSIVFDSNNEFVYFPSIRDLRTDVYSLNIKDGNVKRITNTGKVSFFGLINSEILGFDSDNDLYLINPKLDKEAKKSNIVTDFGMWRDEAIGTR